MSEPAAKLLRADKRHGALTVVAFFTISVAVCLVAVLGVVGLIVLVSHH